MAKKGTAVSISLPPAGSLPRPLFAPARHTDTLPDAVIWLAIVASFVIANTPPKRLSPLLFDVLQVLPKKWLVGSFAGSDLRTLSHSIVLQLIVPAKKLFFFLALSAMSYPIAKAVKESAPLLRASGLKRMVWPAVLLFVLVSILALPYGNPNGPFIHRSGLAGLGVLFGEMSVAPFASDNDIVYGRLLKPAIAHFIHMDGFARYYLFSLGCGFVLVFLLLVFLEMTIAGLPDQAACRPPLARWGMYWSAMTSSFIMTSFQSPGKVDHLLFIFILLMACIPMTRQARLGIVALCMLTHEAIALTLLPLIFFWFPKEDKLEAFLVVGLFYAVMAASYGLDISKALEGHGSTMTEGSVWKVVVEHPGYFLLGLFFSYKLLWCVLIYALWTLWVRNELRALIGLAVVAFLPAGLCLLAWDTTRIGGVGFLGPLIALVMVIRDFNRLPRFHCRVLLLVFLVNLVIPSYNVILYPPVGDGPPIYLNTLADYPYLGLYRTIHSVVSMLLT